MKLANLLEDLFAAAEGVELEYSITMADNVISPDFLGKIRAEIILVATTSPTTLSKLPEEILLRLVPILDTQIQHGAECRLSNADIVCMAESK